MVRGGQRPPGSHGVRLDRPARPWNGLGSRPERVKHPCPARNRAVSSRNRGLDKNVRSFYYLRVRKGERTKGEILGKGVGMASELGIEALTIGSLAKEVGMSKSGLYAHFASKEDLQCQLVDAAAERFVAIVAAPAVRQPRGIPRVRAFFENWLAWENDVLMPGGCLFVALAFELDSRPGPVRDRLVAQQRRWLDALATAARIAVDEKQFRSDLDPRQFAYDMYSIILGYHFFARLMHDPEAESRTRGSFERLIASARAR